MEGPNREVTPGVNILTINCRKSLDTMKTVFNIPHLHDNWDIICIQEPYIYTDTRRTYAHRGWYMLLPTGEYEGLT